MKSEMIVTAIRAAEDVDALRALPDTTSSQDLRQRLIASAITAAWDRLNIAPICRPRLADLEPREMDVLFAALRRMIASRCWKRRPV